MSGGMRSGVALRMPGRRVASRSVMLDAVLKSFGRPKIGRFEASATVRIFLY